MTAHPEQLRPPRTVGAPRRFALHRDLDPTGVSGTGVVAHGVLWPDGACALRWSSATPSTVVYVALADLVAVHGHGGSTRLVWLDPPEQPSASPDGPAGPSSPAAPRQRVLRRYLPSRPAHRLEDPVTATDSAPPGLESGGVPTQTDNSGESADVLPQDPYWTPTAAVDVAP